MSNLQINTTQNVNLDYKIVGIGERIVAFLIDGFILYMFVLLVNLIGDAISYVYEDTWTQRGLVALIFFVLDFIYSVTLPLIVILIINIVVLCRSDNLYV